MVEDHGTPEAATPLAWTRGHREAGSRQRASGAKSPQLGSVEYVSWDECPPALQEGFSILPILERQQLNSRLCPLQRRRESTSSSVKMEEACVSKN